MYGFRYAGSFPVAVSTTLVARNGKLASLARFARTDLAQDHIDTEVASVIMLAGAFVWPVWARAHARDRKGLRVLSHRFAQELLRLCMYGTLRPERHPDIAARLKAGRGAAAKLRPADGRHGAGRRRSGNGVRS